MVSPVIIPDDYSGYTGEERRVVEATFSDDDPEIGRIQRFSVKEVMTVIQSDNGLTHIPYPKYI